MHKRGFCRNDLTNIYGFINYGTLKINAKRIDRGLKQDIINSKSSEYTVVYLCDNEITNRLEISEILLISKDNKKLLSDKSNLEEFLTDYGFKIWTKEGNFLIPLEWSVIYKSTIYGDIIEFFDKEILDTDGYIVKYEDNTKLINFNKDVICEIDIIWNMFFNSKQMYLYTFKDKEIKNTYKLIRYQHNKLWKIEKL